MKLFRRKRATAAGPPSPEQAAIVEAVTGSGLFDPAYYLHRYPEVARFGRGPLTHFCQYGIHEHRDPGPNFDTSRYLGRFPSAGRSKTPPLMQVLGGEHRAEPRLWLSRDTASFRYLLEASGLFDRAWYLARHPDLSRSRLDPLQHLIEHGAREWRDPGPDFDAEFYAEHYPSFAETDLSPLEHYLRLGRAAGHAARGPAREVPRRRLSHDPASFRLLLEASGLFDRAWYLARYEDLARSGLEPLQHLIDHGAREWRDPGPDFDTEFYAEQYPSFVATDLSPLEHYLRLGRAAGHATRGLARYERWITRFDALTAADQARIADEARGAALPPVAVLHVLAGEDDGTVAALRAGVADQIGVRPALRFVREAGPPARPGDDAVLAPADALGNLPDGTVLVLAGRASRLRPHAAYALASALERCGAGAAYADHDRVDAAGARAGPVFKPAMAPDFMRRLAYAGPVVAVRLAPDVRARVAAALAAAAAGEPAAAWADLLLSLPADRVARVPFLLYSVPVEGHADDPVTPVYEPVREDAAGGSGPDVLGKDVRSVAAASPPAAGGPWPQVRVVIPTRDRRDLLEACLRSIFARTDYPAECFRIVVVDNGSREPDSLAYLDEVGAHPACTVVRSPGAFNFARICNDGAAATDGDVLVFLNNDTTVREGGWLRELALNAARPEIGVVGAQLLYPDETVQHGGVILGIQGVGGHRLVGVKASVAARRDVTRETVAVTGACLAVRRALFEEVGRFDPVLGVAFNDTLLCVAAHAAGYRNLYLAEPLLTHHESRTRGLDDTRAKLDRNRREAIYVRERHGALFQDDPSYSPNLSLNNVGFLAVPPRVVRPWRRSRSGERRVLLLSAVHSLGHGVAEVLARQAEHLRRSGWAVTVGGPETRRDRDYPGCRRIGLWTAPEAAALAVAEGMDCVIAHTPPFFSVTRSLGRRPLAYMFDHGEPPPHLFSDAEVREKIDWEKRFCAPLARRVFAISRAIHEQQYRTDAVVVRNGNAHLATWSAPWAARRAALRRQYGFEGRYVIFNVCRFGREERQYKGIDAYIDLATELPFVPGPGERALFVLAGRGDPEDVGHVRAAGLTVFPNVTDAELAELYAASDLYVSLSRWEGYNLGIGQALAMGLGVVASDIPAHREFGIATASGNAHLCALVREHYARWDEGATERQARVEAWEPPLALLAGILEADCAQEDAGPWF